MQTTAIAPSSNPSIFFNPLLNFTISNPLIPSNSPFLSTLVAVSDGFRAQTSIVCARKKRRRPVFLRSTKLVLELASLFASNLKILPPPLDLVVAELSGGNGNGGGSRLWRSFGGGGYDGWRALGFALFSVALIQLWQRSGISKHFVWGFGLFGILIALGLRRSEVQKWAGKLGFYRPKIKSLRRKIEGKKIF
ncbi:uncharacterized protein LOC111805147 isoform X2 [Cucurbita pepo subsp. pepo]|uniref:uncharacterized protein LOC111805147 isoform X2 n=1 Tax=Cucurbita pepo subsp. pepo TaxID=3664 RepID=UPI000C9D9F24|nr:uncharacterized protein LOC111805147 isoform X2 [Cucurbita pepo subsp. pepo]